jgi:nicotinamidase-related amidase
MNLFPSDTVLLVIDVQKAFDDPIWGQRNNLDAEKNIAQLIQKWRSTDRRIIHVHHRSTRPDSLFNPSQSGFQAKPEAEPLSTELLIYKAVNSSFIGTNLEMHLRSGKDAPLVICGLTTDHCVSTTTRMAGNLGFKTYLVSDGTATFGRMGPDGKLYTAEQIHDTALASLHEEFATVVDTQSVLAGC